MAVAWGGFGLVFRDLVVFGANTYAQVVESQMTGTPWDIRSLHFPPGAGIAAPLLLLLVVIQYLLTAAYESGCLRWMVRGDVGKRVGFELNADTWRIWFTYWVWWALHIASSIVFAAIGFVVTSLTGGPGSELAGTASVVWAMLQVLILIYFAVRLSPAGACSIGRRQFSFFEAWPATRGRFIRQRPSTVCWNRRSGSG